MTFADLGLSSELLRAVTDSGYDEPTPIQRAAIPSVLMGKDLVGIAQTGTGKTAGFVLPMIDILHEGRSRARMPRSLILEPTRELAMQVAENFEKYGKYHPLSMALLMGGVQMGDQVKALEKGVDVLIEVERHDLVVKQGQRLGRGGGRHRVSSPGARTCGRAPRTPCRKITWTGLY
jgi:superfamily II DNA/RNA helicase